MEPQTLDLDRTIPDRTSTDNLPTSLAAQIDFLAGRTGHWHRPDTEVPAAIRACALIANGSTAEAIVLLEAADLVAPSARELAAATWSASRVSVPNTHDALAEQIEGLGQGFIFDGEVPVCTVSMLRGLLAVATGNLGEADAWLRLAVTEGDDRAPFWGALARLELARVQLTRTHASDSRPGYDSHSGYDSRDARRNLGAARTFFESAGYTHLGTVARSLLELCEGAPGGSAPHRAAASGTTTTGGVGPPVAAPLKGILHRDVENGSGDKATGDKATRTHGYGTTWHTGFGVQPPARVTDRLGLAALAYVISNRHREVPAVEIGSWLDDGAPRDHHGRPGLHPLSHPTGVMAELARLQTSELSDPSHPSDPDALSAGLRDLIKDDRQRSRVSKLMARTISSLGDEHGALSIHLSAHVRTGYLCSYSAPSEVRWVL